MTRLKIVLLIAFSCVGVCASALAVRSLTREAAQLAAAAPTSSGWTEPDLSSLRNRIATSLVEVPFLRTNEDRQFFLQCYEEKLRAATPGGLTQFMALGTEGQSKLGYRFGAECAQAFGNHVASSKAWTPAVAPVYVHDCVRKQGEAYRSFCECVAAAAPSQFSSPAAFLTNEGKTPAELAANERRIRRITARCSSKLPTDPR